MLRFERNLEEGESESALKTECGVRARGCACKLDDENVYCLLTNNTLCYACYTLNWFDQS